MVSMPSRWMFGRNSIKILEQNIIEPSIANRIISSVLRKVLLKAEDLSLGVLKSIRCSFGNFGGVHAGHSVFTVDIE